MDQRLLSIQYHLRWYKYHGVGLRIYDTPRKVYWRRGRQFGGWWKLPDDPTRPEWLALVEYTASYTIMKKIWGRINLLTAVMLGWCAYKFHDSVCSRKWNSVPPVHFIDSVFFHPNFVHYYSFHAQRHQEAGLGPVYVNFSQTLHIEMIITDLNCEMRPSTKHVDVETHWLCDITTKWMAGRSTTSQGGGRYRRGPIQVEGDARSANMGSKTMWVECDAFNWGSSR